VWYLYAYAEERKALRLFTLSRIKDPTLTAQKFTLPPDFDDRLHTGGSNFGVFSSEKKHRFSIAVYNESALLVREQKWAADQVIEESADGAVVSFTGTQYDKVLEWVLSRGRQAKPLKPEQLVNDWKLHIKGMQKMAR
jgi:predicted DNA-binding transcriptional regulator YafY